MKIKNELIIAASKAIKEVGIVDEKGTFSEEFYGYISSLGAAIVQSGLLPAIIFYENRTDQAPERMKVAKAILKILNSYYSYNIPSIDMPISNFIISNNGKYEKLRQLSLDVTEIATAMKLSLRLFKKNQKD